MKRSRTTVAQAANDPAIDRAAAQWLARRGRGLSPAEDAEFSRWLAASPKHAAVFAGLEETWRSLDRLKGFRPPGGRALDADLPRPRTGPGAMVYLNVLLAAAAVIALSFIRWRPVERNRNIIVQSAITTTGGFEKLDLPDGSIVRLNTDSAVTVAFSHAERRVQLVRGEAIFTVVKDASRPFVVRAGQIDVRAVGTEFNVRLRPDTIEVLVTEGRVRVDEEVNPVVASGPDDSVREPAHASEVARRREVSAGEKMVVPVAIGAVAAVVAAVAPEEIRRELAWQEKRLEFLSTPLPDVVAEFNRYNRHKLVIGDARLNERRFGGTFRADNADAFVRLLESRFGVKAERSDHTTVLRVE